MRVPDAQYGRMYDERLGEEYHTADDWFVQARNGYIDAPVVLDAIKDLLNGEADRSDDEAFKAMRREQAERVGYMAARERAEVAPEIDTSHYNVEQMKLDFMDGIGGIDEAEIADGVYLSATFERQNGVVLISIRDCSDPDRGDGTGAVAIPLPDFKGMNQKDFDCNVGWLRNMGMEYHEQ